MITREKFAELLDNRAYPFEITSAEKMEAKASGLIIVYGASVDLIEFDGAWRDEADAPDTTFVHREGILEGHEDCECGYCAYQSIADKCAKIESIFAVNGADWRYSATVPHSTFRIIVEDYPAGEYYCIGMVINVADLPALGEGVK